MNCRIANVVGLFVAGLWLPGITAADELQQLTHDGRLKRDPIFIDGGEQIVYAAQHDSPQLVLRRLNLSDGRSERFHPESALPEFRACYSTDQAAHSFLQMTGNDVLQLKVGLPHKQQTVSIQSSKTTVWHGTITPNGKEVVYAAAGQIYTQVVENGEEKQLTQTAGRNNHPSVSPDGNRIAFSSSRDGDYEIYSMNRDGSGVQRLTNSRGLDIRPAWSADGQWIAFTTARDGDYEIYAMRCDGSDTRRITDNPERDDYASWHPDGKRLVVVTERDGAIDLFVVPFER
jgi:Tol biopolymer transport system component